MSLCSVVDGTSITFSPLQLLATSVSRYGLSASGLGIRFATMGPIEFVDWGGLDILYYANRYLSGELGNRFNTPNIVEEKMDRGNLGLKSGKGMYDYCNVDMNAYKEQKLETFITLLMRLDLMPKPAKSR